MLQPNMVEELEKKMLDLMKNNHKDFPKELQEYVIETARLFSFINSEKGGSKKERQDCANRIQSFIEELGKAFYECCKKDELCVKPIALGTQTLDVQNEKSFGGDALQSHSDHVGVESGAVISEDKSIDNPADDGDLWGFHKEGRRFDLQEYLKGDSPISCFDPQLEQLSALMKSRSSPDPQLEHLYALMKTRNKLLKRKRERKKMEAAEAAGPADISGKQPAGPTTM